MVGRIKKYLRIFTNDLDWDILRAPAFRYALLLKLIFAFTFASHYLTVFFARFVNYYVASGFQNPYRFFYQSSPESFPYPTIMLWILSLPAIIFKPFLGVDYQSVANLHIFAYRLPLLAADIILFLILAGWLKDKQKKVLTYYWCSPILFYITYIHGQLDVLPMMFLFIALFFLFKERFAAAFVFFSIAVSVKTSIAAALPFAIAYLVLKEAGLKKIILLSLLPVATFLLVNSAYLFTPGFIQMVMQNKEQAKIFNLHYEFGPGLTLYFIPLAYFLLFAKSLTYRTFNKDIFLMFLGFSFGILTFFIPPMQGWYFWIIPFFAYFYIKQDNAPKFAFIFLNILYFAYFLIAKNSDYLQVFQPVSEKIASGKNLYAILSENGINADVWVNMAFTLLQATLLVNILWIYRKGIESNIQYKIKYNPYLIGIAGDSGSGKRTVAKLLVDVFKDKNTLRIEGDDMHKWERGHAKWSSYTHLNPKANNLHHELENVVHLKNGEEIQRSFYDHQTGKFTIPKKLRSKKVIVFHGLHYLYLDKMRDVFDLKIFLAPKEDLRLHWKTSRDMKDRGYSKEKILEQITKREGDAENYVKSQEQHADIVIAMQNREAIEAGTDSHVKMLLKIKFNHTINIDLLVAELEKNANLACNHYYDDKRQYLEFSGDISKEEITGLARVLVPELQDIIMDEPQWHSGYNGLIQLFICHYIFSKMRTEHV